MAGRPFTYPPPPPPPPPPPQSYDTGSGNHSKRQSSRNPLCRKSRPPKCTPRLVEPRGSASILRAKRTVQPASSAPFASGKYGLEENVSVSIEHETGKETRDFGEERQGLGLLPRSSINIHAIEQENDNETSGVKKSKLLQPINIEYNGRLTALQSSTDLAAWINERRRRFPGRRPSKSDGSTPIEAHQPEQSDPPEHAQTRFDQTSTTRSSSPAARSVTVPELSAKLNRNNSISQETNPGLTCCESRRHGSPKSQADRQPSMFRERQTLEHLSRGKKSREQKRKRSSHFDIDKAETRGRRMTLYQRLLDQETRKAELGETN